MSTVPNLPVNTKGGMGVGLSTALMGCCKCLWVQDGRFRLHEKARYDKDAQRYEKRCVNFSDLKSCRLIHWVFGRAGRESNKCKL